MQILTWDELKENRSFQHVKSALTIGVFDGLHLGHRKLIERVVHNGAELVPVAVTFHANPQNFFKGQTSKRDIVTPPQKLAILESLGVKITVMIDFSHDFSRIDAKTFFTTLATAFQIKMIVVGENFHFGKNREAGHEALKKMCASIGALLDVVETVHFRNRQVSSTRIRHLISEGNIDDVRMMLLEDYVVVVPDHAVIEREGEYSVIAREDCNQVIPLQGTFRCRIGTGEGEEEGIVKIEKDRLFVGHKNTPLKTLCFLEKLPEGN
jgi:riboflavin kinase/FMN adenylyltransferase